MEKKRKLHREGMQIEAVVTGEDSCHGSFGIFSFGGREGGVLAVR